MAAGAYRVACTCLLIYTCVASVFVTKRDSYLISMVLTLLRVSVYSISRLTN